MFMLAGLGGQKVKYIPKLLGENVNSQTGNVFLKTRDMIFMITTQPFIKRRQWVHLTLINHFDQSFVECLVSVFITELP